MGEDCFAELGLERRLGWSAEELRDRYDLRCRELHPDAGGEADDFQRLREAYVCLAGWGSRLRHWLELGGHTFEAGGALPADVGEVFGRLGPLLQRADDLGKRRGEARSALARSMSEREAMDLMPQLEQARAETEALIEKLGGRFGEFDERGVEGCGEEAASVAQSLLFLEKWEQQLRTAWSRLGCW